ncbi:SAM-dependent methyltransferase [Methanobrevibacter sp. YE315]|uniref:class I SAM-dependent methyltransferase n=1 Tax=Methanobrevibacter sp. YE315 TaxID=1609968 RepID=UPI000764CFCD|nr:class I SAM-dependent methyltransferase [Methanobrevibacter sp. YE315]AMD17494.1 SAM-dependent methyltransferase [Methanobrevibacter sp. YE315]
MIKLSYDVKNYRNDLLDLVESGDTVIELGCHTGGTTRLLPSDCNVIAIDNSPEATDEMAKLDVTFISGDVRLHEVIAEVFKIAQSCDVLAIDLGGGYHPDTVFKVFYIWSSTFKPKHTVIRNRGILEFFNSAIGSDEKIISEEGYLETYHDSGIPPLIKEFDLWTPKLKK